MKKWIKISFLCVVLIAALIICLFGYLLYQFSSPPKITIINNSNSVLQNIIVSGSGFLKEIKSLEPQTSTVIKVHPPGESGLIIKFKADSREFGKDDLAYIESSGGYRITITISDNLEITSKQIYRKYWFF